VKGQSDLPPITSNEDLIKRIPLLTGYRPYGEIILLLAGTHITWSSVVDPDYLRELPQITTGIRNALDPLREQKLYLIYTLPLKKGVPLASTTRRSALRQTMAMAQDGGMVYHAPEHCPDLDLSIMVGWDMGSFLTSACTDDNPDDDCLPGEGHPITGDLYTLPGVTVYADRESWERAFEVGREDIVPTPDVLARMEVVMTNLGNHPREMLAELATDPRGLDDAGALALTRYIKGTNADDVARSWLANGWSIDNLMRLVRCTSSVPARSAVATTLACDGYLAYARSVGRTIPSGMGSDLVEMIRGGEANPMEFMQAREEVVKDLDTYRLWS